LDDGLDHGVDRLVSDDDTDGHLGDEPVVCLTRYSGSSRLTSLESWRGRAAASTFTSASLTEIEAGTAVSLLRITSP
jgi:hypothetical protein